MILRQMTLALAVTLPLNAAAIDNVRPQQLSDEDQTALMARLVEQYPEVASSPGFKALYYDPADPWTKCDRTSTQLVINGSVTKIVREPGKIKCSRDSVSVFLLPHAETLGRKEALRATCERLVDQHPDLDSTPGQWNCTNATFRQYVQLEEQICEVRLTGSATTETLVAARTSGIDAIKAAGEPAPEALVLFTRTGERTAWGRFGTNECRGGIVVEFLQVSDTDPKNAGDWSPTVRLDYTKGRSTASTKADSPRL